MTRLNLVVSYHFSQSFFVQEVYLLFDMFLLFVTYRHPVSSSRLSFSEIVNILKDKDNHLLSWSEQDRHSCPLEGRTLGSSLYTSENLFIDLQLTYSRLT